MSEPALPPDLNELTARVAKQTRLWRREREQVARDLRARFAGEIAAGRDARGLVREFGPIRPAAKKIRRERLRERPVAWHVWRRGWQAVVGFALAAVVFFASLVGWLHLAGASPHVDLVGQIDAGRASIPPADRAWPYIREALLRLVEVTDPVAATAIDGGLTNGPAALMPGQWVQARDYLRDNEASLQLLIEGTSRPELGFVYRDPANNAWLEKRRHSNIERTWPGDKPVSEILLPQIQDLHHLAHLLLGAVHHAVEDGERDRVAQTLMASVRLARLEWNSAEFPVIENLAANHLIGVCQNAVRVTSLWPELLGDADLIALQATLDDVGRRGARPDPRVLRRQVLSALGTLFSDDGQGEGRLSARGADELQRWLTQVPTIPELSQWRSWLAGSPQLGWRDAVRIEVFEALLASTIGGRRENLAEAARLLDLHENDLGRDFWDPLECELDDELTRLKDDSDRRHRFLPVVIGMGVLGFTVDRARAAQIQQAIDSARLAVALERFRRNGGGWPTTLDELVPGYLEAVPVDIRDGRPLRYALTADGPLVYSVGPDLVDNTAKLVQKNLEKSGAARGDEQLLPPEVIKPGGSEPIDQ